MDAIVAQYRERQDELLASSKAIVARADQEKRELTSDDSKEIDANTNEFERLQNEIGRRLQIAAQMELLATPQGRRSEPDPLPDDPGGDRPQASRAPPPARVQSAAVAVQPRASAAGNAGFRSFGDFAQAVRNAALRGGETDLRLMRNAAASTYGQEGVGADGGFAVPPDFRSAIMGKVFAETSLISRTDQMQSTSNTLSFPTDMTTPWQTTGGIQAYWENEAAAKTQSKPLLEQVNVRLHKLAALVPVTDELLEDAPSLDSYLRRKVAEKIDFKISHALIWGTGAGQPLGVMNSPALVTQAAEGGQTTDTINATNIVKMYARMPASSIPTSLWLIHPDAQPQLPIMTLGQQPVYLPPGGLSAAPNGSLLGRPVIPHQVCETVGDLGDIMFIDFNQYMTIVKAGGIKTDVSIHLWFDQDMTAYRFVMRLAGQPWWSTYTSSRDGTFTQSPFVTLASR